MKTKLLFTLTLFFYLTNSNAQDLVYNWGNQLDGNGNEVVCKSTAVDNNGNVYNVGFFKGTVDFNPSGTAFTLTANGTNRDSYITKFDANGNFIWANVIAANTAHDYAYSVTVDVNSDIIIAGQENSSAVKIYKYSPNGTLTWTVTYNGSSSNPSSNRAFSTTTDNLGNIYTAGTFSGIIDFMPGTGTFNLTNSNGSSFDSFITKLDPNGNFIWAKQVKSTDKVQINKITLDANNDVLFTGDHRGISDFNPSGTVTNLFSDLNDDAFICKWTNSGNYLWARRITDPSLIRSNSVVTDANNNVYIAGYFYTSVNILTPANSMGLSSNGDTDCFLIKYNSIGNLIWAKGIGDSGPDAAYSIDYNGQGELYFTGKFTSTVDFDTGTNTSTLTAGGIDAFIAKFDTLGNFILVKQFGGASNNYSSSILVDGSENIYMSAHFTGTTDLDPNAGVSNVSNITSENGTYIVKLSQCFETTSTVNISECTSYSSPSGNYTWTASNTYTDTIMNVGGCDSIITINLTITGLPTIIASASNSTICLGDSIILNGSGGTSYIWNNSAVDGNYIVPNDTTTFTVTGTDINGCQNLDSITVIVNPLPVITATSQDNSICEGVSTTISGSISNGTATFSWNNGLGNGQNHTISPSITTIYTVTGTNTSTNCFNSDSIEIIVNPLPTPTITPIGFDLTTASFSTYQWFINGNIITGGTSQSITPIQNGNYSVYVIDANNCSNTSADYNMTGVSINENSNSAVKIYPNPAIDVLTVSVIENVNINIYNSFGKLIYTEKMTIGDNQINVSELPSGMYFIQSVNENSINFNTTFIKQ